MKKIILLMMMSLAVVTMMYGQDDYYYYKGEKYPLTKDYSKVARISSRDSGVTISARRTAGASPINTISDDEILIEVFDNTASGTQTASAPLQAEKNVSRQYCYAGAGDKVMVPTGYLYVKLKKDEDYPLLEQTASELGCRIVRQNRFMPLWYTLRIIPGEGRNSVSLSNAIYETGRYAASSPALSYAVSAFSYDDTEKTDSLWNIHNIENEGYDIQASAAWNYSTGRGIVIAIIDKGVDVDHEDLKDNIYHLSYDADSDSSPSKLYDEHGTHCAGIAAAVRNNKKGIAGVAPDAKIMPVSCQYMYSLRVEERLSNSINWAWQNGADVLSCSWHTIPDGMISDAIDCAVNNGREGLGCVYVNAAGNTSGSLGFPADYSEDVIAVANMTKSGILHETSAYGSNMFVTAPGTHIWSTVYEPLFGVSQFDNDHSHYKISNLYDSMTGTSMACPHVAGVAALILERNPNLSQEEVREIIGSTATKVPITTFDEWKVYGSWNEHYGYGLVNAYEAVKATPVD